METFWNWLNLMCHSRFFLFLFGVERVFSRFSLVRRLSSGVSDIGGADFLPRLATPRDGRCEQRPSSSAILGNFPSRFNLAQLLFRAKAHRLERVEKQRLFKSC
jgi:hypothetical protein